MFQKLVATILLLSSVIVVAQSKPAVKVNTSFILTLRPLARKMVAVELTAPSDQSFRLVQHPRSAPADVLGEMSIRPSVDLPRGATLGSYEYRGDLEPSGQLNLTLHLPGGGKLSIHRDALAAMERLNMQISAMDVPPEEQPCPAGTISVTVNTSCDGQRMNASLCCTQPVELVWVNCNVSCL